MVEPLQYKPIIEKLFKKTQADRVPWEAQGDSVFHCQLEEYRFSIRATKSGFSLTMKDSRYNEIFSVTIEEEIYFSDAEKQETFQMLSDLYELARRRALNVPEKLVGVAELLDRI